MNQHLRRGCWVPVQLRAGTLRPAITISLWQPEPPRRCVRENVTALIRALLEQRYPEKLVPAGIPAELARDMAASRQLVYSVMRQTGWTVAPRGHADENPHRR